MIKYKQDDTKYINKIEKMIVTNKLEKLKPFVDIIDTEFSKWAYLKSLIDMKKDGAL